MGMVGVGTERNGSCAQTRAGTETQRQHCRGSNSRIASSGLTHFNRIVVSRRPSLLVLLSFASSEMRRVLRSGRAHVPSCAARIHAHRRATRARASPLCPPGWESIRLHSFAANCRRWARSAAARQERAHGGGGESRGDEASERPEKEEGRVGEEEDSEHAARTCRTAREAAKGCAELESSSATGRRVAQRMEESLHEYQLDRAIENRFLSLQYATVKSQE